MNIAIVTGASSGMGKDFVYALDSLENYVSKKNVMKFDEIWVIARRENRLVELQNNVKSKLRILPFDLTEKASILEIQKLLEKEKPVIKFLVNASGFGKFQKSEEISIEDQIGMVDLNIKAMMLMTNICIPYFEKGSKVVEIASQAAWQPIPYINVYSATKSFVLHYSRALNCELKKQGVHVLALCPFWTKTEFFNRAVDKNSEVIKHYACLYESKDLVKRAIKDSFKKKDVSLYGFTSKLNVLLSKVLPHKFVMWFWMKQQKLK